MILQFLKYLIWDLKTTSSKPVIKNPPTFDTHCVYRHPQENLHPLIPKNHSGSAFNSQTLRPCSGSRLEFITYKINSEYCVFSK